MTARGRVWAHSWAHWKPHSDGDADVPR